MVMWWLRPLFGAQTTCPWSLCFLSAPLRGAQTECFVTVRIGASPNGLPMHLWGGGGGCTPHT